jgi:hypothetical protein
MKMFLGLACLMSVSMVFAVTGGGKDYGYLEAKDQQYYKNESFSGSNQLERIDSTVKEINKVYGEMNAMKAEIAALKKEVELLKSKK